MSIQAPNAAILVVDDNAVNLMVISGLLKTFGISADTEISSLKAIDRVREKSYDIVFLDHMMPEIDGLEVARRILAGDAAKSAPCIIAISSNTDDEHIKLYLEAGMKDFIKKPVDKQELDGMLKKWLPEIKTSGANPLDGLRAISGLDVEKAIANAGDNVSDYEARVQILIKGAPKMAETLQSQAGYAKNIAAIIRGVSAVLQNAGAFSLAGQADEIRQYAINGDTAGYSEKLAGFIERFNALYASLTAAMNG